MENRPFRWYGAQFNFRFFKALSGGATA